MLKNTCDSAVKRRAGTMEKEAVRWAAALLSIAPTLVCVNAFAAEGGTGVYLLGMKNPGAAITPPEGFYYQNDLYFYSGSLDGGRGLPTGGKVVANVDADAVVNLSTFLWSTPWTLAGGRLSLNTTLPIGNKTVDAGVQLAGPRIGVGPGHSVSDDVFTVGDPTVGATLGWNAGNLYWQSGASLNVPVGDYHSGALANLAFHHWGLDLTSSGTWFDPQTGFDLSGTIGATFNSENPDTDYRTGTELHFEWSASQYFTRRFSAGLVGFYYKQLTPDSGSGAVAGDFEGRVAAVGLTAAYVFKPGRIPITARIKVFHDFAVQNRASGNGAFVTMTIPLSSTTNN
ncbi:transporter [Paraburkholderia sp. J12]|uniref:SphA family protein n=1 Tax=Paraburkholderia sp. J12 TaxID=2805432 RepID=UPI002ABE30EC|nr:transporter [Paraburkholderia sp. J12]